MSHASNMRGEAGADKHDVRPVLLIGGPTASGKSGLAVALAERLGGEVVNADAMQVYRELRVVTARPSPEDEARVPHRLYGHRPSASAGSAGIWRADALAAIAEVHAAGRVPVLVGGTGLYMKALVEGIAEIPAVPADVRAAAEERIAGLGGEAFRAELVARDPASARLRPSDRQRLVRAWEVLVATGRPISDWQSHAPDPPAGMVFGGVWLDPPRDGLAAAIEGRLRSMVEEGAVEEVEALLALDLDPALPAMKAVGVPEFAAYLAGRRDMEATIAAAAAATRRLAKRQRTWFSRQTPRLRHVGAKFSESLTQEILSFLRHSVLTRVG